MNFKILNFQKTERILENEYSAGRLTAADYWEYYLSGIENIVNTQDFVLTDRHINERSDILAYNFYENEALSDVIVLINNDNYLWDAPADYDLMWDMVDNKMQYLQSLNKVPFDEDQEVYWREKMQEKVEKNRQIQGNVVIPIRGKIQKIIRNINNYLEGRRVK